MTLSEFLLARIAEDEAAARAAVIAEHVGYKPHPELAHWSYEPGEEVTYRATPEMRAHEYYSALYVTCDSEGITPSVDETVGPHIARHDPARVLAECEAKRRIVAAYRSAEVDHGYWSRRPGTDGEATSRARFAAWSYALTTLALPYVDHPDYDEAWRP